MKFVKSGLCGGHNDVNISFAEVNFQKHIFVSYKIILWGPNVGVKFENSLSSTMKLIIKCKALEMEIWNKNQKLNFKFQNLFFMLKEIFYQNFQVCILWHAYLRHIFKLKLLQRLSKMSIRSISIRQKNHVL